MAHLVQARTRNPRLRRAYSATLLVGLVAAMAVSVSASAEAATAGSEPDSVAYIAVSDGATIQQINATARKSGASVTWVRFAGPAGVGETQFPLNSPDSLVLSQARDLFVHVDRSVPPVEQVRVQYATQNAPRIRNAFASIGRMSSRRIEIPPPASQGAAPVVEPPQTPRVSAAVVNDWPSYMISDYNLEASNVSRCTAQTGDPCSTTTRLAGVSQVFRWQTPHKYHDWPNSDWGYEIGISLWNNAVCEGDDPGDVYNPGWWAGAETYEWATGLDASMAPYLDDDRALDACGRLSIAIGIGRPDLARQANGYYYSAYIAQTRPNNVNRSSYSADMQAVSNDCNNLGLSPRSSCMGLNTNRTFPYGPQSEIIVNRNRNFLVPSCVHMHDQWTAPVAWANGTTSPTLPAPVSHGQGCAANT